MGKGNWNKIHAEQNKAAGRLDRQMAKEARKKAEDEAAGIKSKPRYTDHSIEAQMKDIKLPHEMSFQDRWPNFFKYEQRIVELSKYNMSGLLRELRDYADMNERPQQAYKWIQAMWEKGIEPRQAWETIKEKLHWD